VSTFIDLGHVLEEGMPSYPGLPPPRFGAVLTHEQSRDRYEGKAEFRLGTVHMPTNTGTYVDAPFHRFPEREDLADVPLEAVAGLPGIVVDVDPGEDRAVSVPFDADAVRGRAVLLRTGWSRRWGTEAYWKPGPFLAPDALDLLVGAPAALVGVDFWNVDDVADPARPAHTRLLESGVLIVEHLTNLSALPRRGFRFFAVPLRIRGGASFPVRAFAEVEDGGP
jgi:arylformamidase